MTRQDCAGQNRTGLNEPGPDRTGKEGRWDGKVHDRTCQDKDENRGKDWTGQDWTGQDRTEQDVSLTTLVGWHVFKPCTALEGKVDGKFS